MRRECDEIKEEKASEVQTLKEAFLNERKELESTLEEVNRAWEEGVDHNNVLRQELNNAVMSKAVLEQLLA